MHLAVAWVLNNPAVTSAIIGPRTMEQLTTQLGATDVVLDSDLLDRIDEIVPPGTTFNPSDSGYQPPMVADLPRGLAAAKVELRRGVRVVATGAAVTLDAGERTTRRVLEPDVHHG